MKHIALALLAAAAVGLSTAPASAQWGGGYGSQYRDFDEDERPRYRRDYDDERPRYRRRDFEDERPRYRQGPAYGQGALPVQPRMGSICVTPRGNCAVGNLAPTGSACGCPVFGARGVVN